MKIQLIIASSSARSRCPFLFLIIAFCAPLLIENGHAATLVYGDYGVSNLRHGQGQDSAPSRWRAISFTTDETPSTIDQLIATLDNYNDSEDDDHFIAIYANSDSDRPDVDMEIGTFDNASVTIITNSDLAIGGTSLHQLSPSGTISLEANTHYWLVFGRNAGGNYRIGFSSSASEHQDGQWTIGDDSFERWGTNWNPQSNSPVKYKFEIVATPTPIPEPHAILISAFLLGILVLRKRHQAEAKIISD